MKRLVIAAFLFLYAGFTVVTIAEHTSSWAGAFAAGGKSQPTAKWMPSPHPSKTRSVEHPFVVSRVYAAAPLIMAETNTHPLRSEVNATSNDQRILSRAPPSVLS